LAYAPDQDDPIEPIGYGTATSNGAAGGTTLIDTDGIGNSGAADTYNGLYWVKMISGTYKGLQKRIVDDDGAGTLTLENNGFPGQIDSGDEYMIFKSSEPIVVADGGGATDSTHTVDATRDEADDYWIGYSLECIKGTYAGEIALISDHASATGTITHGAFTGALTAKDVAMIRRFIEPADIPSVTPGQSYISRGVPRTNFSKGAGIPGARTCGISFDIKVKGSGSLAGDGVIANSSELHGLFQACGYAESIGETVAVDDAAATTSQIDIDTGTHENFDIGQAIMHQGNVTYITGKTDGAGLADTLDVSPPLPVAPNDNDIIYASRMYYPDTDATQKPVTIYYERDGIRYTIFGCVGNVEFVPGGNTEVLAKFSFTGIHYVREAEDIQAGAAVQGMYSTSQVILGSDLTCHLDTTRSDIGGVNITTGTTAAPREVSGKYGINGVAGQQVTGMDPMIRFSMLMDDSGDALAAEQAFQTQTSKAVSLVYGSHGNCIAFRIPVGRVVEVPTETDQNGMLSTPYAIEAQDAGTADDPTDGVVKVPDFAIHIF